MSPGFKAIAAMTATLMLLLFFHHHLPKPLIVIVLAVCGVAAILMLMSSMSDDAMRPEDGLDDHPRPSYDAVGAEAEHPSERRRSEPTGAGDPSLLPIPRCSLCQEPAASCRCDATRVGSPLYRRMRVLERVAATGHMTSDEELELHRLYDREENAR